MSEVQVCSANFTALFHTCFIAPVDMSLRDHEWLHVVEVCHGDHDWTLTIEGDFELHEDQEVIMSDAELLESGDEVSSSSPGWSRRRRRLRLSGTAEHQPCPEDPLYVPAPAPLQLRHAPAPLQLRHVPAATWHRNCWPGATRETLRRSQGQSPCLISKRLSQMEMLKS